MRTFAITTVGSGDAQTVTLDRAATCVEVLPHESACTARLRERTAAYVASAAEPLWVTSERDYGLVLMSYEDASGAVSTGGLIELLGDSPTVAVRTEDLAYLIERRTLDEQAEGWTELEALLLEELDDVVVISLGEIQLRTFLVGRTECGELAGLRTALVET